MVRHPFIFFHRTPAAAPDVVASWIAIHKEWPRVQARMRQLGIRRSFSHYVWPIHVRAAAVVPLLEALSATRRRDAGHAARRLSTYP